MDPVVTIPAEQVNPSEQLILSHQGIPASAKLSDRIRKLIDEAQTEFLSLARPQGLGKKLTRAEFESIYHGEGRNQPEDPLLEIYPQASHLLLFAVTLGPTVCDRISKLMAENDLAAGSMLDSVASEGADQIAEELQRLWSQELVDSGQLPEGQALLRFSPGYCGWHISGQKRIFESLKPAAIGVSLNSSFLMSPIKSVSGVIVAAPKESFEFDNCFEFCTDCRNQTCQERSQSL